MILNKYKSKRKLGKGAYGEVLLVQDDKGSLYALKLIAMKALLKQSYLMDYLDGQIQCMKTLKSPYIMKLFLTQEDQNFKYLLCEYCDGGDLLNFQAKQNGKVFTLQKSVEILSEVIRGLYDLHEAGYLHRDIKSQNILVKSQNGKQVQFLLINKQTFKLADFGFCKKANQVGGTVLGTQNYMAPQIYHNQTYGFQVDMWAFGVLFYFMLNMEFPFKINPHLPLQKKQTELIAAATNFSYQKYVKQTKKKIMANCTHDVQDLFKQMFDPNGQDRITFAKIRQHPLFVKHFPGNQTQSKILYSKKFQSKTLQKGKQLANQQNQKQDNVMITYSVIKKKNKTFPKQNAVLDRKKDQIDFLKQNALQFYQNIQHFQPAERNSLAFNLMKYYIILLREFIDNLNPKTLEKLYPGLQWPQFCKTNDFKDIKKQAEQDRQKYQIKFDQMYDQCAYSINQINTLNPKFKAAYQNKITDTSFEGAFKESYRKSTHTSFNTLRTLIKNSGKNGNKLNFNLAILVISHVFNHIFGDPQNMNKIFVDYFNQKSKNVDNIDYSQLRQWMTRASAGQLNALAKQIIQLYFA